MWILWYSGLLPFSFINVSCRGMFSHYNSGACSIFRQGTAVISSQVFFDLFLGSCFLTKKLKSCTFDLDSCDFVDVPFADDHDFVLKSSGGQDGKGMMLDNF